MRDSLSSFSMRANRFLFLIGAVSGLNLINLLATEPALQTPKKPVSNDYQGTAVEDPYQWLEKDDEPDVKAWSNAQNQRTRQYLDRLPGPLILCIRPCLYVRLIEIGRAHV